MDRSTFTAFFVDHANQVTDHARGAVMREGLEVSCVTRARRFKGTTATVYMDYRGCLSFLVLFSLCGYVVCVGVGGGS